MNKYMKLAQKFNYNSRGAAIGLLKAANDVCPSEVNDAVYAVLKQISIRVHTERRDKCLALNAPAAIMKPLVKNVERAERGMDPIVRVLFNSIKKR